MFFFICSIFLIFTWIISFQYYVIFLLLSSVLYIAVHMPLESFCLPAVVEGKQRRESLGPRLSIWLQCRARATSSYILTLKDWLTDWFSNLSLSLYQGLYEFKSLTKVIRAAKSWNVPLCRIAVLLCERPMKLHLPLKHCLLQCLAWHFMSHLPPRHICSHLSTPLVHSIVQFAQTWWQMADEHVIWTHLAFHTHDCEQNWLDAHRMLQWPKKHFCEQVCLPNENEAINQLVMGERVQLKD